MQPLRELLRSMTSDRPPDRVVDEFVRFCRKTALVLLRRKVAAGRLNLNHVSLTVEDLALDCVADLFARNAEGNYIQLRVYLKGVDVPGLSDAELMALMRRLVFAKVNQGIFRVFHDIDPSLSRIIRNIKISIHALENYVIVDRFGEPYIVPTACDPLEHLPQVEPAALRDALSRVVGKSETIPDLMAHLSRWLRDQDDCSRLVPMVRAALVFRSLFTPGPAGEAAPHPGEMAAIVSDATEVIAAACLRVKNRAHGKYVLSGKVCSEVFEHYFAVIESALVQLIVERDGHEVRYYDELAKRMPGLSRKDYRESHKSKLEYLGRIAHRRALKDLKKIF